MTAPATPFVLQSSHYQRRMNLRSCTNVNTAQLNCGDLNGDGEVNGADLGRMLISWGRCQ